VLLARGTHLADWWSMVTSALVITFDGPASEQLLRSDFDALDRGDAQLTCGDPQGCLLPAVLTSEAPRPSADLLRELERLPCVRKVDVVAIDFGSGIDVELGSEEQA
jgi:hypothetical protein